MENSKGNELENGNQTFLIYQDDNGIARVNVRFEGEDVWLTVEQMMELFDASQQGVSYHINQIYAEGEQSQERTHKKYLLVRQEGTISHEEAKQKAIAEFEKYRKLEMLQYESDYDRAIKELIRKENKNNMNL